MANVASDVAQIYMYLEDIMMTYYATHMKASQERAIQLEQMTRVQGMADDLIANVWLVERRKRITSSTAGQTAKRRATTKVCSIVKTLLYTQFRGNTQGNNSVHNLPYSLVDWSYTHFIHGWQQVLTTLSVIPLKKIPVG